MASLHPPPAVATAAPSDLETTYGRLPDDLFLKLCFAAFPLPGAATMRATLRQRNGDPFLHPRGDRAARLPAIASARFPARPLRTGFWCAARVRRGLPFAGAPGGFQFPAKAFGFLLQPLRFTYQPLAFLAQMLIFRLGLLEVPFGDKVDTVAHIVRVGSATRPPPTLP